MRRRIQRLCVAVFFLTFAACGHAPTAPVPTIEGVWQGTIESGEDGPGEVTLRLTQADRDVTGDAVLAQNGLVSTQGTVVGTLTTSSFPTSMHYTVTYEFGPFQCRGALSGDVTVTPTTIQGPFTGANCVQPFSGFLRATKQH